MDLLAVTYDKLSALAAKGIPRVMIDASFLMLVLGDRIYFDKEFVLYSVAPINGYFKWSDLFLGQFKGYQINAKLELLSETAPTHNLGKHMKVFLSKELEHPDIE